ncbi:MAG: helix-turn-helix domain-containing protein [Pseudomonadota bacterium]
MSVPVMYPITIGAQICAQILGLDPERVLVESGLSYTGPGSLNQKVTASQFIEVWKTIERLSEDEDIVEKLGVSIARGATLTAFFALTFAPNARIGLARMVRYSQLLGPVHLHVTESGTNLRLALSSADPDLEVPPSLAAVYCVGYVEKIRSMTAHPIVPVEATLNQDIHLRRRVGHLIGCTPLESELTSLTFSACDADRPFISENGELWTEIETDLNRQLSLRASTLPMAERVKVAILDLLPKGMVTGSAVADVIGVSRSTLQRRLAAEAVSFHQILEQTRKDLAIRYVSKSSLSNSEISFLLAYKDPNSFYRGFKRWTGLTPRDYRATAQLLSDPNLVQAGD